MSKAELHDYLWPGTFVTEANLASLVAELRRALGDRPNAPKFIRTVQRFGYGFCGAISDVASRPAPAVTCWMVWAGREIPLREGVNIIGRDPMAAVQLDFPSVSRQHARVVVSSEGATVEDLGSKNGTLVGTAPIHSCARLNDFDEIQVGSVRLTVRILHSGEPTQTVER
jgi:hypothetical protein